MSSSLSPSEPAATSDVNVKINVNGRAYRKTIALSDMQVGSFENSIRKSLCSDLPDLGQCIIERYSDSAGCYTVVDRNAPSSYKQLYRAAKAKGKLRLRLTEKPLAGRACASDAASTHSSPIPPVTNKLETGPFPKIKADIPNPSRKMPKATVRLPPIRAQTGDMTSQENETTQSIVHELPRANNLSPATSNTASIVQPKEKLLQNLIQKSNYLAGTLADIQAAHGHGDSSSVSSTASSINSTSCTAGPAVIYPPMGPAFQICCNACSNPIESNHWHCSKCDMGDYDICPDCFAQGRGCEDDEHWLIRRSVVDGVLMSGSTEVVCISKLPSAQSSRPESVVSTAGSKAEEIIQDRMSSLSMSEQKEPRTFIKAPTETTTSKVTENDAMQEEKNYNKLASALPNEEHTTYGYPSINRRTCNGCVNEFPDEYFVHCTWCPDFDLCFDCFTPNHGHNPAHEFIPLSKKTVLPSSVTAIMEGRHKMHHALCDGCDKTIFGIRYKCLDCPDWDFCSSCSSTISITHKGHRFVKLYEPMTTVLSQRPPESQHYGVYCDGPLCVSKGHKNYISGVRYKCGFCNDLDFCSACEASPSNSHDRTHPMIMMKTPTSQLVVSTYRYDNKGRLIDCTGDNSEETRFEKTSPSLSMATEQAVADVKPVKQNLAVAPVTIDDSDTPPSTVAPVGEVATPDDVTAPLSMEIMGQCPDKMTFMPAGYNFDIVWEVKNDGRTAWPGSSRVELNWGDQLFTPEMHMEMMEDGTLRDYFRVTSSAVHYDPVLPGEVAVYTISVRAPLKQGIYVSGWRLTMCSGERVGNVMTTEVHVKEPIVSKPRAVALEAEDSKPENKETTVDLAKALPAMVFPTLETESPAASMTQHAVSERESPSAHGAPTVSSNSEIGSLEDYVPSDDWVSSDAEFMTDEEYDILDGPGDE
ncbi:hypothetical protein BROUX41_003765 [Berkeleyomyces rouxiae]